MKIRCYIPDIILFEYDALMVQGLEVILFVLIPPDLVKLFLHLPPLGVFRLQPAQHQRHRYNWIPLQPIDNIRRLVAVYPAHRTLMDGGAGAAKTVVKAVAGRLFRRHTRHFLLHALQHFDGVAVGLQHHVELEALVLCAVDVLLVLGLAAGHKLRVLAPRGEAHPGVVEHL